MNMTGYVDGFLLAIPKNKVNEYKKMARLASKIWIEHGAIGYFECIEDDVKAGKITSFPQAVKLKKGEVVFFSYITYKSRADRNRVNKKVMSDPRLAKMCDPKKMPFDSKRMMWGGFKPVVKKERI